MDHTNMPPLMQLSLFFAAMAAFVATGCILTRKPKPKVTNFAGSGAGRTQPGCFPHEE